MPFCPLYKEATEKSPWSADTAHLGLVFNKFPDAWTQTGGKYQFDKGDPAPGQWLARISKRKAGQSELLKEACRRQRELVEAQGGKVLCFKNVSRFITGLGNAHPSENGLTWHHTLGVPYLPGSALKGLLRAWERESNGEWTHDAVKQKSAVRERKETAESFGTQNCVGKVIFFDVIPLAPVSLAREIMTPHYGEYYSNKGSSIPGDWDKPNPVQYLAVDVGVEWQVAIAPGAIALNDVSFWDDIDNIITEALDWSGAGAKTSTGLGRFERVPKTEVQWRREKQEAAIKREQQIGKEKDRLAKEATYAAMSESLAEIQKIADEEGWLGTDGQPDAEKFPGKLETFLQGRTEIEPDVTAWLKICFERRHPTLWVNPDQVEGKKNKPVHKPRWSKLVKLVKSLSKV